MVLSNLVEIEPVLIFGLGRSFAADADLGSLLSCLKKGRIDDYWLDTGYFKVSSPPHFA